MIGRWALAELLKNNLLIGFSPRPYNRIWLKPGRWTLKEIRLKPVLIQSHLQLKLEAIEKSALAKAGGI